MAAVFRGPPQSPGRCTSGNRPIGRPDLPQSGGLFFDPTDRDAAGIYNFPTMMELLANAAVTWKYYTGTSPLAENLWNPLPEFKSIMDNPKLRDR
jgi:hypothetical protein